MREAIRFEKSLRRCFALSERVFVAGLAAAVVFL